MKRCSICRNKKPLTEFYKDRTTKDGLDSFDEFMDYVINELKAENNRNR